MRRRDVFTLGALIGGAYGLSWWIQRPTFEFFAMDHPAGFRRLAIGATSGAGIFAGLDEIDPKVATRAAQLSDPCPALFLTRPKADQVPLAVFSDYNCSYCRVLTREVAAIEDSGRVAVTWHELPILGPTSVVAARVALGAELQDAYRPVHRRLMSGRFVPTPGFISALAQEYHLDADRLIDDMDGPQVNARLTDAHALAQVFAIPGTPALVVGRTYVLGNISPRQLSALIDLEAESADQLCF